MSQQQVSKQDLDEWIAQLMKTKKITEYTLNISGNSVKGDGYLGEVTFASVSTPKKSYSLVIKSAKKSEELRKQTPIKEAYDRESFVYAKVFPVFREFQLLKPSLTKPFDNVPKCYSVHDEDQKEAIILQNLKVLGFELHDRKSPMNLNHVLLVFRSYAKFHALSLAFKKSKSALFNSLTKNMTDVLGRFVEQAKMIDIFKTNFEHVKKLLEEDCQTLALKKYECFEDNFEKILVNFSNESTPHSVILHGDCWNNNFMFKYEGSDKSKPSEMRFLDFQLSRVASPILDLSYFLYCCAEKTVLDKLDFILQAYHSSLSDFLEELGCQEEVFPFRELKEQWATYGKFGLVMSLFILKISLCDSDEAPDLMDAEKGEGMGHMDVGVMKNQDEYERRIKDNFIHFAEKFM